MILAMTLFVRNEEDIIESNLVYHLERGVDFIVATDNRSEDGTTSILERYAREGHVRLLREDTDSYSQPRAMERMAHIAADEYEADWVINNDADEFWWPREGSLKELLSTVPDCYGALTASRVNFVARPQDGTAFSDRMIFAKVREVSGMEPKASFKYPFDRYAHYVMPKVAHRGRREVGIVDASHGVIGEGLASVPGWFPVDILHFPLRSYAHFEAKVRNGGRALERHPDRSFNPHLRELYDLYQRGALPEYWEDKVFDDDAVATGIADVRLTVDRRLERWFRERRGSDGPSSEEALPEWPEPSRREASMLRAITVGEWHESRARKLERQLAKRAEQMERLERRMEKVREESREVAARLAELETSKWWGSRLASRARHPTRSKTQ